MILEIFIDTLWIMLWAVDGFSCRVNCLRFLRTISAFQKNKFKQLQSSWYFDAHDYCIWINWLFAFPVFWFMIMFDLGISYFHWNFLLLNLQVRALHYLHSNRIIHRDMKPQNILIGAGSVVKVELPDNRMLLNLLIKCLEGLKSIQNLSIYWI